MVHTAPPYLKEHLNKVAKATLVDLKSKIVCNKLQALKILPANFIHVKQ